MHIKIDIGLDEVTIVNDGIVVYAFDFASIHDVLEIQTISIDGGINVQIDEKLHIYVTEKK